MMSKEISAVLESQRKVSIQEFEIPNVEKEGLLLKVESVGICGSDVERYIGTEFEGTFKTPFPIIMGHEVVGYISDGNQDQLKKNNIEIGDRVTIEPYILCGECDYCLTGNYQLCKNMRAYGVNISCKEPPYLWGAYGEYMYVAPNSRIHRISKNAPKEAACLSSIIGNGIRWSSTKGNVKLGDSIVVIGPGTQGLAAVLVADYIGAGEIIIIGTSKDKSRLNIAKDFGADHSIIIEEENAVERVKELTDGKLADVVICCVGVPAAIDMGLDLVKPLGTFVLVGLTGENKTTLSTDRIVMNELKIFGGLGQSYNVEAAVKLIESCKYPIEKMVTHTFSLNEAEKALITSAYEIPGEEPIKAVIIP
ncbi:MAG: zinc-binding dehydrogenase [Candidatus Bathyarchaeota archaeon]|nr:zinc-binding dehydrogenase [Candidatus Bathyarchaeota archaeon]